MSALVNTTALLAGVFLAGLVIRAGRVFRRLVYESVPLGPKQPVPPSERLIRRAVGKHL